MGAYKGIRQPHYRHPMTAEEAEDILAWKRRAGGERKARDWARKLIDGDQRGANNWTPEAREVWRRAAGAAERAMQRADLIAAFPRTFGGDQ